MRITTVKDIVCVLPKNKWQSAPSSKLQRRNVLRAYGRCYKKGVNPFVTPIIIDVNSSPGWSSFGINECPCLTRSRCTQQGYWCSTKGGLLDVMEMAAFQGLVKVDWMGAGVSESQFGACVGNAMSNHVLRHLLPKVLFIAKLITAQQLDTATLRACSL